MHYHPPLLNDLLWYLDRDSDGFFLVFGIVLTRFQYKGLVCKKHLRVLFQTFHHGEDQLDEETEL